MIEALAANRADEPLREGILPRAVGRGQHFTDPHALHALLERVTVDAVAVAEEIGRRGVLWEGRSCPCFGGKRKGRILPVSGSTSDRPPARAATGGTRHGRAYQEGRAAA